jgi:hypothetical protein
MLLTLTPPIELPTSTFYKIYRTPHHVMRNCSIIVETALEPLHLGFLFTTSHPNP